MVDNNSRIPNPDSRVPSPEVAIRVDNLTKVYKLYDSPQDRLKEALNPLRKKYHRDFYALNGVSFEVRKGETVGIIGQNGAGKSTLLKVITGVLTPTSGLARVNGRISALLELGAGFNPDISGLENVYFNGTILGFSREEMDAKLDDILSFADIGDFIHQPVKIYSSGMFVRLAFALAVHVDPEILIVDEALSVGDVMFKTKCFDKIKSLMEGGATTLFVTHDMNTVTSLCDRAIMLDGGTLFAEGSPKDVSLTYFELQRKREHEKQDRIKARPNREKPKQVAAGKQTFKTSRDENEHRFGSRVAEIIDFKVINDEENETLALETGKRFKIWMHIVFYGNVNNPAIGAMIRNPQGQNLFGMHTYHEKRMNLGAKTEGDILCISLESKMLLNPGRYTLSIGIADHSTDSDYQSVDSRNNVAVLDIFGKTFSYGIIHNDVDIAIESSNPR